MTEHYWGVSLIYCEDCEIKTLHNDLGADRYDSCRWKCGMCGKYNEEHKTQHPHRSRNK